MTKLACLPFAGLAAALVAAPSFAQPKNARGKAAAKAAGEANRADARNKATGAPAEPRDPELAQYGIYEQSAPRATATAAIATSLPLKLQPGELVGLVKSCTAIPDEGEVPLVHKPVFWAVIVGIVFIALNIYFW